MKNYRNELVFSQEALKLEADIINQKFIEIKGAKLGWSSESIYQGLQNAGVY